VSFVRVEEKGTPEGLKNTALCESGKSRVETRVRVKAGYGLDDLTEELNLGSRISDQCQIILYFHNFMTQSTKT